MIQSLWSASSGMNSQQMAIDNVANNMANVNTPGYKKSRIEFQDLLYAQIRSPRRETLLGQVVPNGIQVGNGARAAANQIIFEQGSMQTTDSPTDFALAGNAFFEVLFPNGQKAYTRDGSFKIDQDGVLVTAEGGIVNIEASDGGLITFPEGASKISINSQGLIFRDKQLLQLEQYGFLSSADLEQVEPGIFIPSENSGEAVLVIELADKETEEVTDEEGNPIPQPEKPKPQAYYQVTLPEGETAYTTESNFKIDESGRLVTAIKGYPLDPEVIVDTTATDSNMKVGDIVSPDSSGIINVSVAAGKLNVVQFVNPAGLQKSASNLYVQTANSGQPQPAGDFKVMQGMLESSNVQVAEEMVNMIMANRAYELSSRAIKTSDDMLGLANQLLKR